MFKLSMLPCYQGALDLLNNSGLGMALVTGVKVQLAKLEASGFKD
jgi:hypothetical protein